MPTYEKVKEADWQGGEREGGRFVLSGRSVKVGLMVALVLTVSTLLISNTSENATLGHKHENELVPTAAPTSPADLPGYCCFYGGCGDDCKAKATSGFCAVSADGCSTCTGTYCSYPTAAPTPARPSAGPVTSPTMAPSAAVADSADPTDATDPATGAATDPDAAP